MTKAWLDEIPGKLRRLKVNHKVENMLSMQSILGAILHTTNDKFSMLRLEDHQNDFANSGPPKEAHFRSAHFMIDRDGIIAQFRSLDQGAAHFSGHWFRHYIGIEHIVRAQIGERLTSDQMDASADLLNMLKSELGITLSELSRPGANGIGVHQQFNSTACGEGPFWVKGTFGPDFKTILDRAPKRSPVGK